MGLIMRKLERQSGHHILLLLAPLLAQSLSKKCNPDKNSRNGCILLSALLFLWSLVAIVLTAHYLGGYESSLIANDQLAQEIHTFKDLAAANYRILLQDCSTRTCRQDQGSDYNAMEGQPHLRKLRRRTETVDLSEYQMHMHLVRHSRRALLDSKPLLQEFRYLLEKHVYGAWCYIGKEDLYLYPRFWGFSLVHVARIQWGFQMMLESGIYKILNEIHEFWDADWDLQDVLKDYERRSPVHGGVGGTEVTTSYTFSLHGPRSMLVFKLLVAGLVMGIVVMVLEVFCEFVF